jgi:hypothetical protein
MTADEHYKKIAQAAWQLWLSGDEDMNSIHWKALFYALAQAKEGGVELAEP